MQQTGLIRAYRLADIAQPSPKYRRFNRKPSTDSPRVSLAKVASTWFLYRGLPYNVQAVSDDTFKSAILSRSSNVYVSALLQESHLDTFTRWYVLCETPSITLYKSEEEAKKAASTS